MKNTQRKNVEDSATAILLLAVSIVVLVLIGLAMTYAPFHEQSPEDPGSGGFPILWGYDTTETNCSDLIDNDADTLVDCSDSDCGATPACIEQNCNNSIDDDSDVLVDCEDPDCTTEPPCIGA